MPWLVYAAAVLSASDEPAALAARLGLGERPGALLARARSDTYYPEDTPEVILRRLLRPDSYPP
ncbi:hypothetical protein ACFSC4_18410 [Deinococcus malanensis]|uniref:hypothetical protein n=1 Tax=Deinococcus malanensis TaxID=1706855 RepID=UPI0036334B43